jgi:hypothetical protein
VKNSAIKSILFTIASFIIVWGGTAGIAYGATVFHKSLNATVRVTGEANFEFFEDEDDDTPITSVSLPDAVPGGTSTFIVYLKNTGSVTGTVTAGTHSVSTSKGTLTLSFNGQNNVTLDPGEMTSVLGTLKLSSTIANGPFNFSFSIDASSDATTPTTTTTTPSPTGTTTTSPVLVGEQLFQTYCITCHSSGPPNTTRTQTQLVTFISGHRTGSSLSASQVSAIAAYMKQ